MAHQLSKLLADAVIYPRLTGPGIVPGDDISKGVNSLETIISNIIGLLTVVAVIYFIFQVIFAGYGFINSQGDPKATEAAQKKLTYSILGLVIIVIAVGLGTLIADLLGIKYVLDFNGFFYSIGK